MLTKFAYNAFSLVHKVADGYHEYHHFYVTPEQYQTIEPLISGSSTSGSRADAIKFFTDRDDRLFAEASANDGELAYGCCASYVDEDLLMYETTSGTVLTRDLYDDHIISLPIGRLGGFHHRIILLVLAGLNAAQLDRYENLHRIDDEDEFEYAHLERKFIYDSILIPHGYAPYESWKEHLAAKSEQQARLSSCVGEWSIDDDSEEEYENYDDVDDEGVTELEY